MSHDLKSEAETPGFLPRGRRSEEDRRVGIVFPSYSTEHVTYSMQPDPFSYVQLKGVTAARALPKERQFYAMHPFLLGWNTDLVHTFNLLPLNRDFVVSSEMEMPRNLGSPAPWQDRFSYRILRSKRCRAILFLSDAAARFAARRFAAQGHEVLCDKIRVFRGAVQGPPPEEFSPIPPADGRVRVLFVGGDGLRKGLPSVVRAAEILAGSGLDIALTIVGGFSEETYVLPGCQISMEGWKARAKAVGAIHHAALPNSQVRAMMRAHHVLAFPTLDESLGWVTIEAALQGLPTIATDMFAQRELIDHERTGWLLPLETDVDGRWVHTGRQGAMSAWESVTEEHARSLAQILQGIVRYPSIATKAGLAAREKLYPLYAVHAAGRELARIYADAIR